MNGNTIVLEPLSEAKVNDLAKLKIESTELTEREKIVLNRIQQKPGHIQKKRKKPHQPNPVRLILL